MTRDDPMLFRSPAAGVDRCRLAIGAALLMGFALVAGCASSPPKPTLVNGTIQAAANLNPSVSQRPSPLMLRVYELRSPTAFNQADFMGLYSAEQAALGGDLLAREEMTLQPGETRPYNKTLNPETRFVGVFAAYRDLERARWRTVVAVQPNQAQKLTIRADGLALSAQVTP